MVKGSDTIEVLGLLIWNRNNSIWLSTILSVKLKGHCSKQLPIAQHWHWWFHHLQRIACEWQRSCWLSLTQLMRASLVHKYKTQLPENKFGYKWWLIWATTQFYHVFKSNNVSHEKSKLTTRRSLFLSIILLLLMVLSRVMICSTVPTISICCRAFVNGSIRQSLKSLKTKLFICMRVRLLAFRGFASLVCASSFIALRNSCVVPTRAITGSVWSKMERKFEIA